ASNSKAHPGSRADRERTDGHDSDGGRVDTRQPAIERLGLTLGALAGVDPWSYGLGELRIMADARRGEEWDRTAYLAATVVNMLRSPKARAVKPQDCNPFRLANQPTRKIKAGRAHVELWADDSKLVRGLKKASARLSKFSANAGGIGVKLAVAATAGASPFAFAIKAASDAEEVANRFSAVFGEETEAASAFVKQFATDVGRSETEVKDGLSSFQSFFLGLGVGGKEAREMSQELASLAIDFGSFNNLSDDEALTRFLAGMSGSSEVFDKFGINIKSAALDNELLAMGLAESTAKATEQQKAIARFSIIKKTMGKQGAVGDAVKTADGFANTMKRIQSQVMAAATAVGKHLLPVVTPLAVWLGKLATAGAEWLAQNAGLVRGAAAIVAGLGAIGGGLLLLAAGGTAASVSLAGVAAGLSFVLSPMGLLITGAAALGAYLLYAGDAGGAAIDWLKDRFGFLLEDGTEAFEGIKAALEANDWQQAARVLWAVLKLEFTRGSNYLEGIFLGIKTAVMNIWGDLNTAIAKMWVGTLAGLKAAWIQSQDFLSRGALRVMGFFDSSIDVEGADQIIREQTERELASVGRDINSQFAELDRMNEADRKRRNAAADNRLAEAERELAEAEKALETESAKAKDPAGNPADDPATPRGAAPVVAAAGLKAATASAGGNLGEFERGSERFTSLILDALRPGGMSEDEKQTGLLQSIAGNTDRT
ncbi:Phage tail tape measure protein, partial [Durusdinium trenchii]